MTAIEKDKETEKKKGKSKRNGKKVRKGKKEKNFQIKENVHNKVFKLIYSKGFFLYLGNLTKRTISLLVSMNQLFFLINSV